jgi:oxygen-independent coproporphyrinogen-3 oxidase
MDLSLYLHIPFCRHRCAYCDFNTYADQEAHLLAYVDALRTEIGVVGEAAGERLVLHTVFFGGGTPSLLSPAQFESILLAVRKSFELRPDAEITIEANPGTVSPDGLRALREIGLNRLSFGVQSANPEELHLLERQHDYRDVIEAVTWARRARFENLNLDLIFGLPGQRLASWRRTVELVLGLDPEHLSLYALTLEHGTPFGRWSARGLMPVPDPDAAAEMYEWATDFLKERGYEQYEISNWSKPGHQCRHNLQYWRNQPYLGLGAGAHGYAVGYRYSNVLRIKTYIERLVRLTSHPVFPFSPSTVNRQKITTEVEMGETMITGLRLTQEGVSTSKFEQRFGRPLRDVFGNEIGELTRLGLLEWSGDSLRLTRRGRLLGNQVFMRFVD